MKLNYLSYTKIIENKLYLSYTRSLRLNSVCLTRRSLRLNLTQRLSRLNSTCLTRISLRSVYWDFNTEQNINQLHCHCHCHKIYIQQLVYQVEAKSLVYIPVFPRNCGFVIFDHFKHCQLPENEESINNMIIDLEILLGCLFQMIKLSLMLVQH